MQERFVAAVASYEQAYDSRTRSLREEAGSSSAPPPSLPVDATYQLWGESVGGRSRGLVYGIGSESSQFEPVLSAATSQPGPSAQDDELERLRQRVRELEEYRDSVDVQMRAFFEEQSKLLEDRFLALSAGLTTQREPRQEEPEQQQEEEQQEEEELEQRQEEPEQRQQEEPSQQQRRSGTTRVVPIPPGQLREFVSQSLRRRGPS